MYVTYSIYKMATAGVLSGTILAVHLQKCPHLSNEIRVIQQFLHSKSLYNIFSYLHGKDSKTNVQGKPFQVEGGLTVGDVANFGIKYIICTCFEDQVDICIKKQLMHRLLMPSSCWWQVVGDTLHQRMKGRSLINLVHILLDLWKIYADSMVLWA